MPHRSDAVSAATPTHQEHHAAPTRGVDILPDAPDTLETADCPKADTIAKAYGVRRALLCLALLIGVGGAGAGCSNAKSKSKSPLPVCTYRSPGPVTTTKNGTGYTTLAPLCTPPTTTLPAPLALGTTTSLSYRWGTGPGEVVSGQLTVSRVWLNPTPVVSDAALEALGKTVPQLVGHLLQDARLPPGQPVMWVGVEFAVQNTGRQQWIAFGGAGGPGAAVLYLVVNGRGAGITGTKSPDFLGTGYEFGVPDCPSPWSAGVLNPEASAIGCIALAVPQGVKVSTVGFNLEAVSGAAVPDVAQWRTGLAQ